MRVVCVRARCKHTQFVLTGGVMEYEEPESPEHITTEEPIKRGEIYYLDY